MERKKPTFYEMYPDGRAVKIEPDKLNKPPQPPPSLCGECLFSKASCKNPYVREIKVPMSPDDPLDLEILVFRLKGRRKNTSDYIPPKYRMLEKVVTLLNDKIEYTQTGMKLVDGVEAGIYKKEEDIPDAQRCGWFEPNSWNL